MTSRRKILVALGAAVVLLAAAGVFSYRTIRSNEEDQGWVDHTHKVLEELGELQSTVDQASVEERGYFATEEASYLQGYQEAIRHAHEDVSVLRSLTVDNPAQQLLLSRFISLLTKREEGLESRIDFRKQHGLAARLGPGQLPPARVTVEQLQDSLAQMKAGEEQLLERRAKTANAGSRETKVVIVLGNVLGFVLILTAAIALYREMTRRNQAEENLRKSEEGFRLMVSGVKDHALFMLDTSGRVASWNAGAERLKGYTREEVLGRHFTLFYSAEDIANRLPDKMLGLAVLRGWAESEGWRVRKDGSLFWANVMITSLHDGTGRLRGFAKMTSDLTERREAARQIERHNAQLEATNKELEAFSYSVSHDLRAPLRRIDGFSQMLLEDYGSRLDARAKEYLERVRSGTRHMAELIDSLLNLARIARTEMSHSKVDLSAMAESVAADLRRMQPQRTVEWRIAPDLLSDGDPVLLRAVLENLLGNAWKFTSRRGDARIEMGRELNNGSPAFFVRDNGAGFDPAQAARLFGAFQRLHSAQEFPGTGIGLASVQRIVHRHGGRIWAQGMQGRGATFYFTL
jgi:PAS domain S-box-containing protein